MMIFVWRPLFCVKIDFFTFKFGNFKDNENSNKRNGICIKFLIKTMAY